MPKTTTAQEIKSITSLPVSDIQVQDRLRPVSQAGTLALIDSIRELGVMKDPIQVRQHHTKQMILLAGAHRLEAARQLDWTEVPVRVWKCNDDWARLIEIDDNLAGAELNPLDNAIFVAERKALYEKMHPETVAGKAGAAGRWDATDTMSVASFVTVTAEKFGLSERHVRRMAAAGSVLTADEIRHLRKAPKQPSLNDLKLLGGLPPADRNPVIEHFASGQSTKISAAIAALKPQGAALSSFDRKYNALREAWSRAGIPERRKFVQDCGAQLQKYMDAVGADE
ncbi:MAG: ParB N-terminal domain-containing protein [Pseudomonadota bacterium]